MNGEETIFVYNASGQLVAEYTNQTPQNAPKVSYLTSDHLGSPRITTDVRGDVYTRRDFMPYGEEIDATQTPQRKVQLNYASDEYRQKFTSYERDNETDLDFAEARMMNYGHGRFTSPDPLLSSGRPTSPQSWNRFAYVLNNPLNSIDPNGLYECKGTADDCKGFRQNLADAQAKITDIVEKYGEGSDEHIQAEKALGSYGCESKGGRCVNADGKYMNEKGEVVDKKDATKDTASNVHVSFDWTGKSPANTSANTGTRIVKVRFGKGKDSNLGLIANEGINSADFQNALSTGKSVSKYQSEKDGLFVQAVFGELKAEADGSGSASFNNSGNPVNYWDKGWETADHTTMRANREKAIKTVLKETYQLTPKSTIPLLTIPKGYKPKN